VAQSRAWETKPRELGRFGWQVDSGRCTRALERWFGRSNRPPLVSVYVHRPRNKKHKSSQYISRRVGFPSIIFRCVTATVSANGMYGQRGRHEHIVMQVFRPPAAREQSSTTR
jgi:hypothetical protein